MPFPTSEPTKTRPALGFCLRPVVVDGCFTGKIQGCHPQRQGQRPQCRTVGRHVKSLMPKVRETDAPMNPYNHRYIDLDEYFVAIHLLYWWIMMNWNVTWAITIQKKDTLKSVRHRLWASFPRNWSIQLPCVLKWERVPGITDPSQNNGFSWKKMEVWHKGRDHIIILKYYIVNLIYILLVKFYVL